MSGSSWPVSDVDFVADPLGALHFGSLRNFQSIVD
jgi:hypothetical protein